MTQEEASALKAQIKEETRWRNVDIKQLECGWVTAINRGTHDIYVWSTQDWHNYCLTMGIQTKHPTKK